jgi:hypothetical protein
MTDAPNEAAPTEPVAPETPPAAVAGSLLEAAKPAEGDPAEKPAGEEPPVAATPFDPEKFTPPEGVELAEADRKNLGEMAKKHGLTNEAMSDLLTTYADRMKAASEASAKTYQDLNDKWQNEVKADPEIGGDKLPATLQTVAKVLDDPRFAVPGVKEALTYTGAGNNPQIVKLLYKMSAALTEGGHVSGNPAGASPQKVQPGASAMYPNLPNGA